MEEKLIELVRAKPELYDLANKLYSDNVHKKKVWEEIGKALEKSGKFQYSFLITLKNRMESLFAKIKGHQSNVFPFRFSSFYDKCVLCRHIDCCKKGISHCFSY